jgi:hypothetical protein
LASAILWRDIMKGKVSKNFIYDNDRSPIENFNFWLSENESERFWNEEKPLSYKESVDLFEKQYCVKIDGVKIDE